MSERRHAPSHQPEALPGGSQVNSCVLFDDVTAKMRREVRREARRQAVAVLVAAGWDYGQIALAFGIVPGAAQELMPPNRPARRRVLATPLLAAAAREAGE